MDERDFPAVVEQHFPAVWGFARRRLASATEADDVTAETFAVAWRRRDDLPDGDGVRLWLFGCARRVLANHLRSTDRRARLHRRVEGSAATVAPEPDPADTVVGRDGQRLLLALATLAEGDRDLLVLRAWDGLAVTDIATLLDITPNAVSVRLTRARTRLATALDADRSGALGTGRGRSPHREGGAS